MEVLSPPRGKKGQFTSDKGKMNVSSRSSPLLKLATVALATAAVISAHSSRTPLDISGVEPGVEIAPKKKRRRSDIYGWTNST